MKNFVNLGELHVPPEQTCNIYIVRPSLTDGPWIAGGSVRQWFSGKPVASDVDVYLRGHKQLAQVVKRLESLGYSKHYDTTNAITYKATASAEHLDRASAPPIQLIIKNFFNTPDDVLDSFDIVQSQLVTDGYTVYGNPDWNNREIGIANFDPKTILARLVKYSAYGFKIKPGQLSEIADRSDTNYSFKGMDDYE